MGSSDFDSWLSNMVSLAQSVGENKRKQFYDMRKFEAEKQYGTDSTPYGPGFETQKIQNATTLGVAKLNTAARLSELAENKRQFDLGAPLLQGHVKQAGKEQKIESAKARMAIEDVGDKTSDVLGLMKKSNLAESTVNKAQPSAWEAVGNILKRGMGIPVVDKPSVALEAQGLSEKDIMSEQQFSQSVKDLRKLKRQKELFQIGTE